MCRDTCRECGGWRARCSFCEGQMMKAVTLKTMRGAVNCWENGQFSLRESLEEPPFSSEKQPGISPKWNSCKTNRYQTHKGKLPWQEALIFKVTAPMRLKKSLAWFYQCLIGSHFALQKKIKISTRGWQSLWIRFHYVGGCGLINRINQWKQTVHNVGIWLCHSDVPAHAQCCRWPCLPRIHINTLVSLNRR